MCKDFLVLFKPNVNISFHSNLYDLTGLLNKHGFKITSFEDSPPIYHGTAWISEIDKVVIHFYVTDKLELNSIMLTCGNKYEEILSSYQRRQKWLECNYGNPQFAKENSSHGTFDYEWKLSNCNIKHFIHDRFGDEEGIYIECIA